MAVWHERHVDTRRSIRLASVVLATLLVGSGCHRPHDEAKPDPAGGKPALSKLNGQGDPKSLATPEPEKPSKPSETPTESSHGPEPEATDGDDDDAPNLPAEGDGSARTGRRRASSGPSAKDRAADAKSSPLTVKRIVFSEEIDKREPVSPEETFSAAQTDKIYAFVELGNANKAKSHVTVKFIPPMGSTSKVDLEVGDKARWRTWARRKAPKAPGTWTVVVLDEQGVEIGKRTFEVTE